MTSAVSVVLPVYNVATYLPECLESLLSQTLRDIEIHAVDDCSTDHSVSVLRQYSDSRLKIATREPNAGLAATRNHGLTLATGEYVGFVDSDDYVDVAMFGAMSEAARSQSADVVACSVMTHNMSGATSVTRHPLPSGVLLDRQALRTLLAQAHTQRAYWYAQRFLYRRSFLEDNGISFDPRIRLGEDTVFNAQALNLARAVYVLDEPLYHVRHRPQSLTSTRGQPEQHRFLEMQYVALRTFYKEHGLWDERRADHHRYILKFQLPQALNNARHLSRSRRDMRAHLRALREMSWVSEALDSREVVRSLAPARRWSSELMRQGWMMPLTFAYSPTAQNSAP